MSISERLATVGNSLLIITCLFFMTAVGYSWYLRRAVSTRPPPYRPGDVLYDVISQVPGDGDALVLVVRSDCAPCAASLAFHRRLAARAQAKSGFRFIVVSLEPKATLERYVKEGHIAYSGLVQLDANDTRLRSTPTLLWIDADGVIQKQWIGRLTPVGERDVLSVFDPT